MQPAIGEFTRIQLEDLFLFSQEFIFITEEKVTGNIFLEVYSLSVLNFEIVVGKTFLHLVSKICIFFRQSFQESLTAQGKPLPV